MIENKIISIFARYNIKIDKKQAEKFKKYYNFLIEENKKFNLTAITEEDEVIFKHFLDSALVAQYFKPNAKVIDVGSGAGFPGIPIKILRPDLQIVLLDSLQKRVNFLNSTINLLQLDKIEAIHARVEDFAEKNCEKFDYAISRAVAATNTLSEYLLPLVKIGGQAIMFKSNKLDQELQEAKKAISILGGKIEKIVDFDIEEISSQRKLLFLNKEKSTPKAYPRGKNLPKTKPII